MVHIDIRALNPLSQLIAKHLIAEFPGVNRKFKNDKGHLFVSWPSRNASAPEDLVLHCASEPRLMWFKGYMYDFPLSLHQTEERVAVAIRSFLVKFFAEEIVCGVVLKQGQVSGGGPIQTSELQGQGWWNQEGTVIRSWKGTHDEH